MTTPSDGPPRLGRAPWVTAGRLDDAQQALVERIGQDWSGGAVGISPIDPTGRLIGPFDLMAASPQVGSAILQAAASFREADLSVLEREVVILVVSVAEQADFMWEGHLAVALAAGLSIDAGEIIRTGRVPVLEQPLRAVHHVAHCLVSTGDLDDATFHAAVEDLGWRRVQEVVWLVGLYRAFGLAMRVARTPLPDSAGEA
jgi:alkylhydroperoxidase family enzyme